MVFYGFSSENTNNQYLKIVQESADQLLEVGTDQYGTKNIAMWASVIDLEDLSVPLQIPYIGDNHFQIQLSISAEIVSFPHIRNL